MEIMKKSVKDFLKEREDDLNIPPLCIMRGCGDKVEDVRVHYSKKCKCFLDFPSFYAYKDEKENEYILFKSKRYSLIKYIWKKIEKMIEKKEIHCNVKKIITQLNREYKKREERRERSLKNPSGYFLKDNPEVVNKDINKILDDFVDYWYGLTQCLGIIREKVVKEYISEFLKKKKFRTIRKILKEFEKKVIEEGGVVEIS